MYRKPYRKVTKLKSKFSLIMDYLNRAWNNPTQVYGNRDLILWVILLRTSIPSREEQRCPKLHWDNLQCCGSRQPKLRIHVGFLFLCALGKNVNLMKHALSVVTKQEYCSKMCAEKRGKRRSCGQLQCSQRRKKLGKERKCLLARCKAYVNSCGGQCLYL